MALPRNRGVSTLILAILFSLAFASSEVQAQTNFNTFTSQEYGFSLKYPDNWVKLDKPRGNYYVVFQAPDLMMNFRNRIHVACHRPVKDPLKVFLEEFRNGIKTLQEQSKGRGSESEEVRILDEGEFTGNTPGAYYFFIQALDDKLKIWMDIVIVFYKHEDTLLRISCLAPSKGMEQMQPLYNEVLVSVTFSGQERPAPTTGPAAVPSPSPGETGPSTGPSTAPSPGPGTEQPAQPAQQPGQPNVLPKPSDPGTSGPGGPGPSSSGPASNMNQTGPGGVSTPAGPAPGQPGQTTGPTGGPTSAPGIVDRN